MVLNVHERRLEVPVEKVEPLLHGLATQDDPVWPHEAWPALRCDGPFVAGVRCGHGPVRYTLEAVTPGRTVVFRFTAPKGFVGTHGFTLTPDGPTACLLRHTLVLKPKGRARLTWPLFFRPLHDAVLEDALDKVERRLGLRPATPARWSWWVRILRRITGLSDRGEFS